MTTAKFRLGRIVCTSNAKAQLTDDDIHTAISRHQSGDWGQCDREDRETNDQAVVNGSRVFSVYRSAEGVKFYVITEASREHTTVLLPEDY